MTAPTTPPAGDEMPEMTRYYVVADCDLYPLHIWPPHGELNTVETVVLASEADAYLAAQLSARDAEVGQFIGWLSVDIPELHGVEVPRLAESLKRFKVALAAKQE